MSEAFDKKVTEFFRTYQDRGMKKWQGFFLSDHTSTLRKDRQQKAMTYPKKAEMSAEEVSAVLFKAFSDHYQVSVQLKTRDKEGLYKADIVGFVQGYQDDEIIINGKAINLDGINHIEMVR